MPPQITVRPDGVLTLGEAGLPAARATGTPGGTSPMYGAGGLFGISDSDPTVINAMVGPIGVERALYWQGSDVQHPLYESLVWMGSSGYDQATKCAACGTPHFHQCTQSAVFGRACQQTNEHAIDDIGLRANVNVPRVAMFGNITDPAGNVLLQEGQPIKDMFTMELAGAGYNLRYRVGWLLWNGNPVNSVGGAIQPPGIPIIVNTGKIDVRNGMACDALDSQIVPYNQIVGAAGATPISDVLFRVTRSVDYRIQGMNKNTADTTQFFVVHPRTWDCVARQIVCEYGLVCATATDRNDAWDMREMYNRIKSSLSIPVDGKWYPVVLDNIMPSTPVPVGTATGFTSDIYFFTTVLEGMTIFWGEYQDFQKTASATIAWFRSQFGSTPVTVSDGGRFMWAPTTHGGFCFDARVLTKPRLVCKMPQLQGRVTGVTCVPTGSYPDVTGSGGTYELDGGLSRKPYLGLYGYEGHPPMPGGGLR